jgi:hypothetical protein
MRNDAFKLSGVLSRCLHRATSLGMYLSRHESLVVAMRGSVPRPDDDADISRILALIDQSVYLAYCSHLPTHSPRNRMAPLLLCTIGNFYWPLNKRLALALKNGAWCHTGRLYNIIVPRYEYNITCERATDLTNAKDRTCRSNMAVL